MKDYTLRMTGKQHALLRSHLFPGDGLEAIAVALCGRRRGENRHVLCVHEIHPIAHELCLERRPDRVRWSPELIRPVLDRAAREGLSLLKIHSHPAEVRRFSALDDESDAEVLGAAQVWTDTDDPHASAVMLPDGEMFGRVATRNGGLAPLSHIAVAGDDILHWFHHDDDASAPEFARRHAQLFGDATTLRLQRLRIAVVGCSGTGSPLVEMLARLGVGRLVLVDPKKMAQHNLNRIVNATQADVDAGRFKVDVLGDAVERMGLGVEVVRLPIDLATERAVKTVAGCDILFGCVDGAFGRMLLERLAAHYCMPYFDLGVMLEADGRGGIKEATSAVHYTQPDGSSLRERGVYTQAQVTAESLHRHDPEEYARRARDGYIAGVDEDRPAVVSINTHTAATAVNEMLARLHPYRTADNDEFAEVRMSYFHGQLFRYPDKGPQRARPYVGRGDVEPILGLTGLIAEDDA